MPKTLLKVIIFNILLLFNGKVFTNKLTFILHNSGMLCRQQIFIFSIILSKRNSFKENRRFRVFVWTASRKDQLSLVYGFLDRHDRGLAGNCRVFHQGNPKSFGSKPPTSKAGYPRFWKEKHSVEVTLSKFCNRFWKVLSNLRTKPKEQASESGCSIIRFVDYYV